MITILRYSPKMLLITLVTFYVKLGLVFSRVSYYLNSFLLISMIELDHQRSAAKTLFNKMGLDIFMLLLHVCFIF